MLFIFFVRVKWVKMISSPIPYDPGYGGRVEGRRNSWSASNERPKPRVKPEAEEIANKAKGTIANLLVTGQPVYRPPVRQSMLYKI